MPGPGPEFDTVDFSNRFGRAGPFSHLATDVYLKKEKLGLERPLVAEMYAVFSEAAAL